MKIGYKEKEKEIELSFSGRGGKGDVEDVIEVFKKIQSKKKPVQVKIDLSGLDHVESALIGVLIHFHKEIKIFGGTISIHCTQKSIQDFFESTKLNKIFDIKGL